MTGPATTPPPPASGTEAADVTGAAPAPSVARPWAVFRHYTLWSLVVLAALLPPMCASLLQDEPLLRGTVGALPTALVLLQSVCSAVATLLIVRAWDAADPAPMGENDLPHLGVIRAGRMTLVLPLLPLLGAAALAAIPGPGNLHTLVAVLAGLVPVQAIRLPWTWGLLAVAATAVAGNLLGLDRAEASMVFALLAGLVVAGRSSLWLAALVRELEQARVAQAELAVAEERLRFARDLHDVTGRDLSVIAVKAELASQLIERGDPRAAQHGREVAQIARSSLSQMRALVRGYREADLAAELRGTLSLLRSAGIDAEVRGEAADLPPAAARSAAWVLREAGTNILRHAQPSRVRIDLGPTSLTIENDGAGDAPLPDRGIGLRGLAERLAPDGTLETALDQGVYRLTARFGASPAAEPEDPA